MRFLIIAGLFAALAACGQPQEKGGDTISETAPPVEEATGPQHDFSDLEPVNPALLAAPTSAFAAIEPSEVGVFPAATVEEAIAPLVPPEAFEEDAAISVSVRTEGETVWADVVRENIPDDSVGAGQIRVEFRREAEGWFPTNAYRRSMCRRGELANQWSSGLCP